MDELATYPVLSRAKLPLPEIRHVFRQRLMQGQDRLAPVCLAVGNAMQRVRVEQWPVTLQGDTGVPKRVADDAVSTALHLEEGEPLLGEGGLDVLAGRANLALEQRLHGGAAKDKARAAVGEPGRLLLLGSGIGSARRRRAHVEGDIGVEGLEEAEDVVPEDITKGSESQ